MRILRILASITPASLVIWYFRAKGIIIYELLIVSHDVHIYKCVGVAIRVLYVCNYLYKGWIRITRIVCGVSRAQVSEWIRYTYKPLLFFYFLLFFKTLFQYSACSNKYTISRAPREREMKREHLWRLSHARPRDLISRRRIITANCSTAVCTINQQYIRYTYKYIEGVLCTSLWIIACRYGR